MILYDQNKPLELRLSTVSITPIEIELRVLIFDQTFVRSAEVVLGDELLLNIGLFCDNFDIEAEVRVNSNPDEQGMVFTISQGDQILMSTSISFLDSEDRTWRTKEDLKPLPDSESLPHYMSDEQKQKLERFLAESKEAPGDESEQDIFLGDEEGGEGGGAGGVMQFIQLTPEVPRHDAMYEVWYATNRRRTESGLVPYGTERDTTTWFGKCRVFIPQTHQPGSIGSGFLKRLISGVDDRLELKFVEQLQKEAFWDALHTLASKLPIDESEGLVFLHGYNVSFEDAAVRSAQIGCDLGFAGPVAFFSWPSQGSMLRYWADESTIEWSAAAIAKFLADFADKTGLKRIHVIAHSMGNRALLNSIDRILKSTSRTQIFAHMIIAAPDVDTDTFLQIASTFETIANGTTMYVSPSDRAVEVSRWLHKFPRVGIMPPITVVTGVETIAVEGMSLFSLGHGYVASAKNVLKDIRSLLSQNVTTPQDDRSWRSLAHLDSGNTYYVIQED